MLHTICLLWIGSIVFLAYVAINEISRLRTHILLYKDDIHTSRLKYNRLIVKYNALADKYNKLVAEGDRAIQDINQLQLSPDELKFVLRQIHPDKHQNSDISKRATQKILDLKK